MKRGDVLFMIVVALVVVALVLLIVNAGTLFPTPEPRAFVQSLAPMR
jgi:hypothetical protein